MSELGKREGELETQREPDRQTDRQTDRDRKGRRERECTRERAVVPLLLSSPARNAWAAEQSGCSPCGEGGGRQGWTKIIVSSEEPTCLNCDSHWMRHALWSSTAQWVLNPFAHQRGHPTQVRGVVSCTSQLMECSTSTFQVNHHQGEAKNPKRPHTDQGRVCTSTTRHRKPRFSLSHVKIESCPSPRFLPHLQETQGFHCKQVHSLP